MKANMKETRWAMWVYFLFSCLTLTPVTAQGARSVVAVPGPIERVSGGFAYVEGPAYDGQGGVWFTTRVGLARYDIETGRTTIPVPTPDHGGANGLWFEEDGSLLAAETTPPRITRRSGDTVTVIADQWEGGGFSFPNDLVQDAKGGIYFTDFNAGNVFYITPEEEIIRVDFGNLMPNGVILSPDEKTLYVSTSGQDRIFRYHVAEDGTLSGKASFVEIANATFDGLSIDAAGNVYGTIFNMNRVVVWTPEGELVVEVAIPPAQTRNVTWAEGKLYVTSGGELYAFDLAFVPIVDTDGSGTVDMPDLVRLIHAWGEDDPVVDYAPLPNGDGVVDQADLEVLMAEWGRVPNDPTLTTHWRLDETEGDNASDSVADNDGLLVNGPGWLPDGGAIEGALVFDGVDDYVATPLALDPQEGPFTILAWVKGGAPGQVIVSQEGGNNWLFADAQDGYLFSDIKGKARGSAALRSETAITDGDWHRVGLVWDGAHRSLLLDGALVATDLVHQDRLVVSRGGLTIGTGVGLIAGTFWSGLIDDIRIYERVILP